MGLVVLGSGLNDGHVRMMPLTFTFSFCAFCAPEGQVPAPPAPQAAAPAQGHHLSEHRRHWRYSLRMLVHDNSVESEELLDVVSEILNVGSVALCARRNKISSQSKQACHLTAPPEPLVVVTEDGVSLGIQNFRHGIIFLAVFSKSCAQTLSVLKVMRLRADQIMSLDSHLAFRSDAI
eukprot:760353-Hanusia_phi.AAC.5